MICLLHDAERGSVRLLILAFTVGVAWRSRHAVSFGFIHVLGTAKLDVVVLGAARVVAKARLVVRGSGVARCAAQFREGRKLRVLLVRTRLGELRTLFPRRAVLETAAARRATRRDEAVAALDGA